MAGQREQSADASLDDILSSIRRIVSDDLNGADQLREKLDAVQATRPSQPASQPAAPTAPAQPQAGAQQAPQAEPQPQQAEPQPQQAATPTVDVDSTAALIAAARAAAGTPARDFVAAEPRVSQSEVTTPRESLAPFDRGHSSQGANGQQAEGQPQAGFEAPADLGAPIVLPTESEVNGHHGEPAGKNGSPAINGAPAVNGSAPVNGAPAANGSHALNGAHNGQNGHEIHTLGEPIPDQAHTTAQVGVSSEAVAPQAPEPQAMPDSQQKSDPQLMNGTSVEENASPVVTNAALVEQNQTIELVNPAEDEMQSVNGHAVTSQNGAPNQDQSTQGGLSSTVVEQAVTRMLRPMLQDWLDQNMPRLIEQALRDDSQPRPENNSF